MTAIGAVEGEREETGTNPLQVFRQAVAEDLRLLASLHDVEPTSEYLGGLREAGFGTCLGFKLESERGRQALDVLTGALNALPEPIDEGALNDLAVDFTSIYLSHALRVSAEESVWLHEEQLTYQESMFRVRFWYERYGLGARDWRKRPDDHLVLELQFMSHLLGKDDATESLRETAQFMDEHLLRWVMPFAERVATRCATAYFAGAAMLTAVYCEELRDVLAQILAEPRPTTEEIEKRMKPKFQTEEVPVQFVPGMGPAV